MDLSNIQDGPAFLRFSRRKDFGLRKDFWWSFALIDEHGHRQYFPGKRTTIIRLSL
jgi:hypothetical protein